MTKLDEFVGNTTSNAFEAVVKESTRLTHDDDEEVRHIALAIQDKSPSFKIGQSIGVLAPESPDFGTPYHVRLYSIAETTPPENGGSPALSIWVKRCHYIDEVSGERYKGIASNYLCDLKLGDKVLLAGPYSGVFKLPDENTAHLLMVGLGTGIAPFRAIIKHIYREHGGWKGKVRLFYGAYSGLEMLYMNDKKNDLAQYLDEQTFKALDTVSPHDPVNLGQTVEQNAEEVWAMVQDPNTFVYVAGVERIRELFDNTITKIATSSEKWQRRKAEMRAGSRWAEITY